MEKTIYLVCNDVNLINKVLSALPENLDVRIIPRVGDADVSKEEDARNLANLLNSVNLSERYSEAAYVAGQWNNLIQIRANLQQALHKDRWNVKLQADFAKVEADLKVLEPIVNYGGAALNDHLERKYLSGHKFRFLRTLSAVQPELAADDLPKESKVNINESVDQIIGGMEGRPDDKPKEGKVITMGN